MSGLLSLKWNNHSSVFLNLLQSLRVKELYCDTTIVCHGKFYPVHKLVLSTCSEYFEDIFERIECKHPFIIMKDVEPSQLESLLNYMYKGEVNVLQESLPGLIKAAEALKIKGLAVPDDNTPKERSSPSRERKRSTNSTSTSHPSKSRRLEDNSESRENLNCDNNTSRTNRESRLDQLDKSSNKGENGSSEFNSDADHDTSISNSGLQSFIKTEPSERTNPAPDDVRSPGYTLPDTQMKDEGLNFASLLPNDSNEEESSKNVESDSYNEQSSHLYSMEESYQECFNNSATMREELGVPWSEERAGTSTEPDLDGVLQKDPLGQMPPPPLPGLRDPTAGSVESRSLLKPGEGVHKCQRCSFVSKWKCNLQTHMRRAHTREKPFPCSFCDYRSCSSDSLRVHIRTHTGEKPYQCPICPHRTAAQNNLVRHIRRQHTDKLGKKSE